MGVPVAVKDDDRVGARQVDPHAAGARGQKKDPVCRGVAVKAVDARLALGAADAAVDALEAPGALGEPSGKDVEGARELAVDQHPVALHLWGYA